MTQDDAEDADGLTPLGAAARARKTQDRSRADLARLGLADAMRTRQGRAFVRSILDLTGLDADTFSPDATVAAFNQGRRSVGLLLIAALRQAAPDQVLVMIREAQEK